MLEINFGNFHTYEIKNLSFLYILLVILKPAVLTVS
jgi:hypothetical protein